MKSFIPEEDCKMSKHSHDQAEEYGKCSICLEHIAVEYYFGAGDTLVCDECGTEYMLLSKNPVQLSILEEGGYQDDEYGSLMFDD